MEHLFFPVKLRCFAVTLFIYAAEIVIIVKSHRACYFGYAHIGGFKERLSFVEPSSVYIFGNPGICFPFKNIVKLCSA